MVPYLPRLVDAQLGLDAPHARAYHLRQHDGRREVDVVLEAADGRIIGLEITATAAPTRDDARHLAWLRDQLGDPFVAGVVLNTGRWAFPLGERIAAVPIAALWGELGQHQSSADPHLSA